jgi:prophage regulatory protein
MTYTNQINIIRRPEVLKRFGIANTSLHSRVKESLIPPPIPLGSRSVGWLEHELDQVLSFMIAGKSKDDIRALIGHLIDQRKNAA